MATKQAARYGSQPSLDITPPGGSGFSPGKGGLSRYAVLFRPTKQSHVIMWLIWR